MWTLLLVLVVLSTASSKREPNMYFGLSIGAIVLTGDAFFGEWSNGMFNPAVGLGTCAVDIFESRNADGLWIYIVRGLCVPWSALESCCPSVSGGPFFSRRRRARMAGYGARTSIVSCLRTQSLP
jgi:hypothetical protein